MWVLLVLTLLALVFSMTYVNNPYGGEPIACPEDADDLNSLDLKFENDPEL